MGVHKYARGFDSEPHLLKETLDSQKEADLLWLRGPGFRFTGEEANDGCDWSKGASVWQSTTLLIHFYIYQ